MIKSLLCSIFLTTMLVGDGYILRTNEFEITLPSKPIYQTQEVNTANTTLTLHLYVLEQDVSFFVVSHSDYPLSINLNDKELFFKGVINGMVSNFQGTLIQVQDLYINSIIGKEVIVELPDGDGVKVYYYLQDRTLYQLMVKTSFQEMSSKEITNFFTSFKFI